MEALVPEIPVDGLSTTTGDDDLIDQVEGSPEWTQFRDRLAQDMFDDWDHNYTPDSDNEANASGHNPSDGSPCVGMENTSATASESGTRAGKRKKGSKRKEERQWEERFLDIMQTFSQGTKDSLNGIASRLGFEHDAEKKRSEVFDSLSNMHFLSTEAKMVVTMRLCKNPQELSMFFSLSPENKAVMVKMMQEGRL
ncbi:target of rapamycin complex 2 subunit MAPKAP1 [Striga asiatica]|uniref:Target of rapamycin complex 2 subunit MAPKAP1 n=1 Tax=Striga asiatica TaxID=4170 RepID=A0A5A7Q644_STRAF|nr:target of rapamycin complex 2 subunit MAPKAP1 [Striga asiatica]